VRGVNIAYRVHRVMNPKAAVVIIPGRTEAIIKFAELARDLTAQGYSTYSVTLRGQGEAGRMLSDQDKGYVEYFDDYLKDTHAFITTKVKTDNARVFMVAHSLGGAVAVLVNDEYPDDVQALALSSPMLDINLGAFPPPVAATLGEGICGVTDGTGYVLGAGDYERETDFENNSVTHSLNRWKWKIGQLDDDPSIRLGGTTWRWLCQALDASTRASMSGRYSSTPTLMFIAGKDTIVNAPGQEKYCADAPYACARETFAPSTWCSPAMPRTWSAASAKRSSPDAPIGFDDSTPPDMFTGNDPSSAVSPRSTIFQPSLWAAMS
jgi:lysophospholipase